MIKKIAWNTFKNTGNINTFLELKYLEDLERTNENYLKQNNEDNEK